MNFTKRQQLIIIIFVGVITLVLLSTNILKQKKEVYILSAQNHNTQDKNISDNQQQNIQKSETIKKAESDIIVHIEGQVRRPGVYKIKNDARVHDVVEAAGGLTEDADRTKVNLSKKVVDEEFIYVPKIGEENTVIAQSNHTNSAISSKSDGLININNASQEELQTLTGIGPALANRIIEYRNENGSFGSIEQIMQVSGIGEKKFNDIKDKITIN